MLALAGGAAMMGRGKKKFGTDAGFLKSGAAGGASLSTPPILGTDHIKKVVAPVDTAPVSTGNTGNTIVRHGGIKKSDSGQLVGNTDVPPQAIYAARMNAPKGIMSPVYGQPTPTVARVHNRFNRAKGGRIGAKKGGRVTGIAKRGFGRALMKGKK